MQETFNEFQASLDRLTDDLSVDDRESVAADICLASRSAYLDFFTAVTINRKIDALTKETLDGLFLRALATMPDGIYKSSLTHRHEEFQDFCEKRSGQPSSRSSLNIGERPLSHALSDSSVEVAL